MKRKLMLLINPNAGSGGYRFGVAEAMNRFYSADWLPTVYFSEGIGDATRVAASFGGQYDMVVCVGGDGTLSDTVAGLMALDSPPPVGYIPMGTANDVASTLHLSHNPLYAAETILSGEPTPLDVGAFGESGFFTYVAAFGAFTEVSYITKQPLKQALGQAAYLVEGMKQLPKIESYNTTVTYDDGVIRDELIFGGVTNSRSMGGILKLDDGTFDLCDGLFEIILVRNPRTLADMNAIFTALVNKRYDGPWLSILHSRCARFEFDRPVAWTRDGESGGAFQSIELKNHHAAISIIMDK